LEIKEVEITIAILFFVPFSLLVNVTEKKKKTKKTKPIKEKTFKIQIQLQISKLLKLQS